MVIGELAHTNAPGSRRAKRWEDVEQLLDAGISVLTTVNVQHLESLTDVVQQITGVVQRETVPDAVVRRADRIELVDMSPEALRRRLAHGNVYTAEKVDAAMGHYFRIEALLRGRRSPRESARRPGGDRGLSWHRVVTVRERTPPDHAVPGSRQARDGPVPPTGATGMPDPQSCCRRQTRASQLV